LQLNHNACELSISKQCELLSMPRSSFYYESKAVDETDLCALIHQIWSDDQSKGYRMIAADLREYHDMRINTKRVRRIMSKLKIMGIIPKRNLSKNKKPQYKYPYLLKQLLVGRANLVWCTDITYLKLPSGYMYLIAIIDVYSRCILGYEISNNLEAEFCINCLERCIAKYGAPAILNTDQGVQFTSHAWINKLKEHNIHISMDGKGRWADNIWIERFWRTIKYCNIFMHGAETVGELKLLVHNFVQYYNERRLHSVHNYKTPMSIYKPSIMENQNNLFQFIYLKNNEEKLAA
jgi:putative transposase